MMDQEPRTFAEAKRMLAALRAETGRLRAQNHASAAARDAKERLREREMAKHREAHKHAKAAQAEPRSYMNMIAIEGAWLEGRDALRAELVVAIEALPRKITQYDHNEPPKALWEGIDRAAVLDLIRGEGYGQDHT